MPTFTDETYVAISGSEGLEKMTQKRLLNLQDAAVKEGKEPPQAVITQTFRKTQAETLQEALDLLCKGDEKVAVTYFNRGYGLRLETLITETITDAEFVAVDGIYDLTDEASKLPTRARTRKAATAEDLISMMKSMPKDDLAKILAEFASALG